MVDIIRINIPSTSSPLASLTYATVVIAAADSKNPQLADYTCAGVNDEVLINQVLSNLKTTPATNALVLFLDGNFHITDEIIIPLGIAIKGMGKATVFQKTAGSTLTNVFKISGVADVSISDLIVIGNSGFQTGEGTGVLNGIRVESGTDIDIENVTSIDCKGSGLSLSGGSRIRVYHCEFSYNFSHGISIVSGMSDSYIKSVICCYNGGSGIYCTPTFSGQRNLFKGNIIRENTSMGIVIAGSSAKQNAIRGNMITGNGSHGIQISGGGYNHLTNNSVYLNVGVGINILCGYNYLIGNDSLDNTGGNHTDSLGTSDITSVNRISTS